jgi:hypothetical protein
LPEKAVRKSGYVVMPGVVPGIHVRAEYRGWPGDMAKSRFGPAMTDWAGGASPHLTPENAAAIVN